MAREAAPVHGRDRPAVTGHADEAREFFFLGAHARLQRAAWSHGHVPVVGMAERVELDEVDVIDAQPLERAVDVVTRLLPRPRARLGGQEEVLAMARHPRADAQLGVAVARGRVDVVHAVAQQRLEGAVGVVLAGAREGGGAEEGRARRVPGASERSSLDHGPILR